MYVSCLSWQEYEKSQFLSRILYECISREKLDMLDMYLALYQVSGVVSQVYHTGVLHRCIG